MRRKIIGMILILVMMLLVSCGKPTDIMELLDKKEYDKAIEVFDSSKYDEDELSELADKVKERIESKLGEYADNLIELEDIKDFLTTVYKLDIDGTSSSISKAKTKMNELSASKKAYVEASEKLKNGEYAAAYSLFANVIEKDAYYKEIEEKRKECIQKYCDSISSKEKEYTDKNDLDGAKKYLANEMTKDIFSEEITEFIKNKQAELIVPSIIKNAEEYALADNYYDAFYVLENSKYEQGVEGNSEYNNTVNRLKEDYKKYVAKKIDQYVGSNDYSGALSFLTQQGSTADLGGLLSYVNEEYEAIEVKSVIAKADEYVKDNDIETAIEAINSYKEEKNIKDSSELDEYLDNVSKSYISMIMEKVVALEEQEDYIKALKMLNNAKKIINASEFIEEEEKINSVKPVYLYDLKRTNSNNYNLIDTGNALTDTIGNRYEVGNLFTISHNTSSGYVDYYLGYKYKSLTGTIAVDDSSDNVSATLVIEGDNIQLYSIELSRKSVPTPISVDITNANWLRIRIDAKNWDKLTAILSDFQLSDQEIKKSSEEGKKKKKNKKNDSSEETTDDAELETTVEDTQNLEENGEEVE